LNVHYNEFGSGTETVIMLHGSGPGASGWSNFHRNVEPLVNAGYRVILMDSPGWGKSDPVICKGSRSELNGSALKGLMDALAIRKAHLIGNSMGAHGVVAFALANPDRLGRLVLMGGGTGGVSPLVPMPTEGFKSIVALYRSPTLDNLKRMMNIFVYDPSAITEELMNDRLANILGRKDHLENFLKSMEVHPRQFPDVGHRLGEVKAPTLVIWGKDDRFVSLDVALRLVAGIPDVELHVFNKCGHWVQWEHADRFNRMVLDYLQH
jgi:2-hydroxy-6-oxonona-2,4-dienedioate hydrolase